MCHKHTPSSTGPMHLLCLLSHILCSSAASSLLMQFDVMTPAKGMQVLCLHALLTPDHQLATGRCSSCTAWSCSSSSNTADRLHMGQEERNISSHTYLLLAVKAKLEKVTPQRVASANLTSCLEDTLTPKCKG